MSSPVHPRPTIDLRERRRAQARMRIKAERLNKRIVPRRTTRLSSRRAVCLQSPGEQFSSKKVVPRRGKGRDEGAVRSVLQGAKEVLALVLIGQLVRLLCGELRPAVAHMDADHHRVAARVLRLQAAQHPLQPRRRRAQLRFQAKKKTSELVGCPRSKPQRRLDSGARRNTTKGSHGGVANDRGGGRLAAGGSDPERNVDVIWLVSGRRRTPGCAAGMTPPAHSSPPRPGASPWGRRTTAPSRT